DIPQRCQPLGALRGVGTQPEGLGHHQHARALVGGLVVKRHNPPQGHVAVLVLDALRLHALLLSLYRIFLARLRWRYLPSRIKSATRSPIIMVVALVLARITSGITDASATRSPASPYTWQY